MADMQEIARLGTLPQKLRWARAILNIHGALTDRENERVKRRIVKIAAEAAPTTGTSVPSAKGSQMTSKGRK
ncbi:hypothetical protein LCGC14_2263380 [marine sediment metagenome]|uniref:Uncharacterized protein n=1 Tax=marine sediment metagenome TaxID=412755 RepID=A0A0F9FU08_9ZZZZ